MRTVAMCFSLLQLPRCRIQTFANSWWGSFYKLSRNASGTRVLCTDKYELERGQTPVARLWTRRTINTETTGSKEKRVRSDSWIAVQDLRGDENSTFQTLVNPERDVTNAHFHGISTHMVNRSNVPRMKDLIPIIIQYVRSRQIPFGVVLFVAHNSRTFDVPFLKNELFADSLPLDRALMKSEGSKVPSKISLQALREHYNIPLVGSAHRALSDVHSLALVLQRLTYDLKVPSDLIHGSFK